MWSSNSNQTLHIEGIEKATLMIVFDLVLYMYWPLKFRNPVQSIGQSVLALYAYIWHISFNQYLGKTHNSWHRSALTLEEYALLCDEFTNPHITQQQSLDYTLYDEDATEINPNVCTIYNLPLPQLYSAPFLFICCCFFGQKHFRKHWIVWQKCIHYWMKKICGLHYGNRDAG